ncbi:hypothetical protein EON81_16950 [bacterium]|nr:MAG: hypothetical protein EON81_16950 [bacterium]
MAKSRGNAKPNKAQRKEKIVENRSSGMPKYISARLAGISEDTLRIWLAEDSKFADEFDKAGAIGESRLVATIIKVAVGGTECKSKKITKEKLLRDKGETQLVERTTHEEREILPPDAKAAAFLLTHSFGWKKTDRIEHVGDGGGAVKILSGVDLDLI